MGCPLWAITGHWRSLFDHLVGAREQRRRHSEPERLGGLQINYQFVLSRLLYGQVGRLLAPEDFLVMRVIFLYRRPRRIG
jgi:hypothetical protein